MLHFAPKPPLTTFAAAQAQWKIISSSNWENTRERKMKQYKKGTCTLFETKFPPRKGCESWMFKKNKAAPRMSVYVAATWQTKGDNLISAFENRIRGCACGSALLASCIFRLKALIIYLIEQPQTNLASKSVQLLLSGSPLCSSAQWLRSGQHKIESPFSRGVEREAAPE